MSLSRALERNIRSAQARCSIAYQGRPERSEGSLSPDHCTHIFLFFFAGFFFCWISPPASVAAEGLITYHRTDGASISVSPSSSKEDQLIVLVVNATEIDVDGSETVGEFAYVRANNGATILNGTTVATSDSDATVAGTSFVGARRVPATALRGLQIQPRQNWHGDLTVDVSIVVTDSLNSTQTSAIVSQL